jgi:hypothetical protein
MLLASMAKACESGHWVKSISRGGEVVILEDRTVWIVDPADRVDTVVWIPTTEIVVCDDKLINAEDGETVFARLAH